MTATAHLSRLEENRTARARLKVLWMTRPDLRPAIQARCAGDPTDLQSLKDGFKFWANHFCFTHNEHKPPRERVQPLLLWELQEEISDVIIENVFKASEDDNFEWNAYGDKARMMAWTFLNLLLIQWLWQFHGISTVITSKTLEDVDSQSDMNTPFQKLRFQIELQYKQAPWLFPDSFDINNNEQYKTGLIACANGGSQIAGLSPKGKAMRQARALIWFGDEFPHTDTDLELWDAACGTVKVRIVGGTPNIQRGRNCKAYKLRYNKEGEQCHVFELPWWRHPERAVGLTRKPDGTYTSPWWEAQCANKSKQVVAAEYLMDWNVAMGATALYAFRETSCVMGLKPDPFGGPIYRSWDPGKSYGVCWAQRDRWGNLRLLRELLLTEDDVTDQGKTLLAAIAERALGLTDRYFPDFDIIDVGDPYASRTQTSFQEKTEYEMLYANHKIRVQSAYMYSIPSKERRKKRIEILNDLMGKDTTQESGKRTPAFLIDPKVCPVTYEAIKQEYRWKIDKETGDKTDEIVKAHPFTEAIDTVGMIAVKLFDSKRNTTDNGGSRARTKPKRSTGWRRTGRM